MVVGSPRPQINRLGMRLFLASLTMLFGAGILGHLIIRFRLPEWPPAGSPNLPSGMWISTAILALISAVLALAERETGRDRVASLRQVLYAALGLALGFLAMQWVNWNAMAGAVASTGQNMFSFTFWSLTVLHGFHVVGGLVPLGVAAWRAPSGRYGAVNPLPIHNLALYWHFLGVTWIGIVLVLVV
jgi:cytochrome c oxidase subunit 3